LDLDKSRGSKVRLDDPVVVTRRARQENWIAAHDATDYLCRDAQWASAVRFEPVPDVEQETTTGAKYTEGFPKTLDLVGKEHGAELAQDHIELGGGKRQVEGIRVDSSTGR